MLIMQALGRHTCRVWQPFQTLFSLRARFAALTWTAAVLPCTTAKATQTKQQRC